jgi:hypothetical protein
MHLSTTKVWNRDMGRVRKLRTGIALLVTAVMLSTAEAATGATAATVATAVRASLRSELNHYLNAYRVAEHISAVSLAVTFRGRRAAINLAVGSTRYGGGPAISPHPLWQGRQQHQGVHVGAGAAIGGRAQALD